MRCLWAALLLAITSPAQLPAEPAQNPHGRMESPCEVCHINESWEVSGLPPAFDHATTGFPLTGAHHELACRECHLKLVFAHVGSACADCHLDVHRGRLGVRCEECHSPERWDNRTEQWHQEAHEAFPLVGAHARADCDACHLGEPGDDYTGTPLICSECHREDFASAREPEHLTAGFGLDCERCHAIFHAGWQEATFRHTPTFPLTRGHALTDCAACHDNGYSGTPGDCYACHDDDYAATTDPDHAAIGFSLDCVLCHGTGRWSGASYDHALTQFPLTGAHLSVVCTACHADGYVGAPTDCNACHADDYATTSEPEHVAAGFGVQCESCHTSARWQPSTWDHNTLFPIYSGAHRNEWNACADCHVTPSDYGEFECIFCHEHNQNDMDDKHSEEPGYAYLSSACFECHPRGDE